MSMSTGGSTGGWYGDTLTTSTTLGAIATSVAICFLLLTVFLIIRYIFIQRLRHRRRAAAALEPPKVGLDPSVIASLPTFIYQKSSGRYSSSKQEELSLIECAICLSLLDQGEAMRLLPNCNHVFHRDCIDVWLLDSNATCPVCRATADPRNPSISAALTALPL